MIHFLIQADEVLRDRAPTIEAAPQTPRHTLAALTGSVVIFGFAYGAVMGTYGGRAWQVVYSAAKVPLLLLVTFALSLPSFFVLNTLLGVRADFTRAVRALAATQAGLTIILISLAPFTWLWYASSDDYEQAILFNALMFAVASVSAQGLLRRSYRPLIAGNARHRWLLRIWIVIYAFVGIQMGWILRPFIGNPRSPVQFFRPGSWGNAYEVVFRMICDMIGPRS